MTRVSIAAVGVLVGLGWSQAVRSHYPRPTAAAKPETEGETSSPQKGYVLICRTPTGEMVEKRLCESLEEPSCRQFMFSCMDARNMMVISRPGGPCEREATQSALQGNAARKSAPAAPEAASLLALFPNPTQGTATLRLPESGTWTARLYNSLGQLVAIYSFTGTETTLALPPQKGLYWVLVEGAGQTHRLPLLRE